jgi:hypothetical protein
MASTKKKVTSIPETNEIQLYFHCRRCLIEKPDGMAPNDYRQLDVGWTAIGLQVWCRRHECNIVHIHFEGQQHPAAT